MVRKVKRLLGSFQSKILISFFIFSCLLLVWAMVCLFIGGKYRQIQAFTQSLSQVHSQHSESVSNLQYFMLAGYHQPSFYTTYRQEHIDEFLTAEESILQRLQLLQGDTVAKHIRVDVQLQRLINVHERLLAAARKLKEVYHKKGFKDHGLEGMMRTYAHYLEDSTAISATAILQLRRYEKDYLLRGENKDVEKFNVLIDQHIDRFATGCATWDALLKYKSGFNLLVSHIEQLGINNNTGVYGMVQNTIQDLDHMYANIDSKVSAEVVGLNSLFKNILVSGTAILLLLAVITSVALSKILTKEVKELNKNVIRFIRSRFSDDIESFEHASYDIAEIEMLNRSFVLLVTTLKNTLQDLGHVIAEEKRASIDLADTVTRLQEKMEEVERQKLEIKNSEAKLEALFNSSSSCHVMIDADLRVIAYNNAAKDFVSGVKGEAGVIGERIVEYLSQDYTDKFLLDFNQAIKGIHVYNERFVEYGEGIGIWWDVSFVPVKNKEGRIIAVSYNATNITQRKVNEQKIQLQNEALLKIAHVQSHHIRGPLATIMGLMNVILLENNFNKGYLLMLREAVDLLDRRIQEIVKYTEGKNRAETTA